MQSLEPKPAAHLLSTSPAGADACLELEMLGWLRRPQRDTGRTLEKNTDYWKSKSLGPRTCVSVQVFISRATDCNINK